MHPIIFGQSKCTMYRWCMYMYVHVHVHQLPYSGKFLHGAKFRTFRGWVGYRENKNRKSLNVRTTCGLNTEMARKLKPRTFFLEAILANA